MTDASRLPTCWTLSLALHIAAGVAFLHWRHQAAKTITVIGDVDFLEPEPIRPLEPAERNMQIPVPPKSIVDFLKLALPKIEKTKNLEEPAPFPKTAKMIEPAPSAPLELKKGLSSTQPDLNLGHSAPRATRLEDVEAARQSRALPIALAEAPLPLEEVGRVAAPRPSPMAEPIELRQNSSRSELLAERLENPKYRPSSNAQLQDAPIALDKTSVVPRPALAPEKPLPIARALQQESGAVKADIRKLDIATLLVKKSSDLSGLAGEKKAIELSGPISNRKILKYTLPVYPQWAKDQGIAADVTLEFFVTAEGKVGEKIKIQRTSGYSELDQRALESLRAWAFEPLESSQNQWGFVTLRYILE